MGLVRSIAAVFSRFARRSSTSSEPPSADPRHLLGRRGERIAARHLRRLGYKVLYRNYRAPNGGEVDIVCRDRDTLVFVEVKTRTSDAFGAPAEAVTPSKQRLIARGALAWLRLLGNPDIYYRFDIVEIRVTGKKTEAGVIRNAFTLPEPYRD
ncbi:MAG: YraN family protein [Chthoniobacteraceae bacterium]|nr:YraN family protein [Chthoniobacteraceae bacterium]